jgi:phospholipid-binding lipoprotein MlaA
VMNYFMRIGALIVVLLGSGCATTNNPNDPLEGYNRAMFSFNDGVDRAVAQPVAKAYKAVTPQFVRTGVSNFFGNISDLWSGINQIFQGRIEAGASSLMRVAINTTIGLGGLLDVAGEMRLPSEKSDFGQTLGKWGVGSGPYVVLPLLGPSTLRDTVGLPADFYGNLWTYKDPVSVRNTGTLVGFVNLRARYLDTANLLEDASLDKYSFVRDAYLQRRQSQIDGASTQNDEDDGDWE